MACRPELVVELASPADYDRQSVSGDSGRWTGPRYEERGNPANAGFASLDWRVRFDEREGDAEAVTFANVLHPELGTRPARRVLGAAHGRDAALSGRSSGTT